nr:hypothetical protein [Lysinibacillus timonensis]
MDVNEIIRKVNNSVDELEFATARIYIEENMDLLIENKNKLKSNAREILNFLQNRNDTGEKPLTKIEMSKINTINMYASKFDVRGIKLCVKGNEQLLLKKEVINFLNADAKIILEGMGAIKKD